MSAVVILPPKGIAGLAERSHAERQALFHVAGSSVWARDGIVVQLRGQATTLLLALAGSSSRYRHHAEVIEMVWPDPDRQPLNPQNHLKVIVCQAKALRILHVAITTRWHWGRTLVISPLPRRADSAKLRRPIKPRGAQHWLPMAIAMRERGATFEQIGAAVGRSGSLICRELSGRARESSGPPPCARSEESKRRHRLRREARAEARETGRPVEEVARAWGCERLDRSRLWDEAQMGGAARGQRFSHSGARP